MSARINNKDVKVGDGQTILEAAKHLGIEIPTLCHKEGLSPFGGCRICVVEVEGRSQLVGACHTPLEEGMSIFTHSPKVIAARKAIVELLFSGHTGPCVTDGKANECDLHNLASSIESGPPRFRVKAPRFYPVEEVSPYIRRDMAKCVLCGLCERACREIAGQNLYSTAYRGFKSKVVVDYDEPLDSDACKDCGICAAYCPTSALIMVSGKVAKVDKKESKSADRTKAREKLLAMLETEQRERGYVSRPAMVDIAKKSEMTLSEVYGVATFYSFISVDPKGRNVIRVCGSLPCYMKDGQMITKFIKEELCIDPGETTKDGKFSLEFTNCIGACDQAPAMLINDEMHGNLTPEKITSVLKSYR